MKVSHALSLTSAGEEFARLLVEVQYVDVNQLKGINHVR